MPSGGRELIGADEPDGERGRILVPKVMVLMNNAMTVVGCMILIHFALMRRFVFPLCCLAQMRVCAELPKLLFVHIQILLWALGAVTATSQVHPLSIKDTQWRKQWHTVLLHYYDSFKVIKNSIRSSLLAQ